MMQEYKKWCEAHPNATNEETKQEWNRQTWRLMFFNTIAMALISL